jgi:flagellar basal body-associated protein FliL
MGIFQMIILAVMLIVAVVAGNIISHKMIQKAEEKKAQNDLFSMMLQQIQNSTPA